MKRAKKRGKDMAHLKEVLTQLAAGQTLLPKYRDHQLSGNWRGRRECHIDPDWLLIYRIDEAHQEIIFERTGSHVDLF